MLEVFLMFLIQLVYFGAKVAIVTAAALFLIVAWQRGQLLMKQARDVAARAAVEKFVGK